MKNTVCLFGWFILTCQAYAQEWKTDLKDGFSEAAVSGKDVLLYFTVADNCETCRKLEDDILETDQFKSFARENLILVKQDFHSKDPEKIEENLLIVEKYNKDGFFPHVVLVNKKEKTIGQMGAYKEESPSQYISRLQSLKTN